VFDENSEKTFYDSEEERRVEEPKTYVMDPDHRLLLRNTKPLLQSRNTAVSTHTHTHTHTHIGFPCILWRLFMVMVGEFLYCTNCIFYPLNVLIKP